MVRIRMHLAHNFVALSSFSRPSPSIRVFSEGVADAVDEDVEAEQDYEVPAKAWTRCQRPPLVSRPLP